MPLVPSVSITTSIDPPVFTVNDTSTGSDVLITDRQILLNQVDNSPFGGSPIDFPLSAGLSLTLNPLTQDISLSITLNWLNAGGTILYSANAIFAFLGFTNLFLYRLTEAQGGNPAISQDTNYYTNKMKLFTEVQSALNAINTGNDVFAAQQCIDRAFLMTSNQSLYF